MDESLKGGGYLFLYLLTVWAIWDVKLTSPVHLHHRGEVLCSIQRWLYLQGNRFNLTITTEWTEYQSIISCLGFCQKSTPLGYQGEIPHRVWVSVPHYLWRQASRASCPGSGWGWLATPGISSLQRPGWWSCEAQNSLDNDIRSPILLGKVIIENHRTWLISPSLVTFIEIF